MTPFVTSFFYCLDLNLHHNTFDKMASLQAFLQENLNLKTIKDLGSSGGGCISNSRRFSSDIGDLFVKTYQKGEVSSVQFYLLLNSL